MSSHAPGSLAHSTRLVSGTGKPSRPVRLSESVPGWECLPQGRKRVTVGILPGEGIGPEIMPVASEVLRVVLRNAGLDADLRTGGPIGQAAERTQGRALTPEVVAFCEKVFADGGAILCGPGGGRFVYDLRTRFDLYCKLTPIHPLPALADTGAVKATARQGVSFVVVRENAGGVYFGQTTREVSPDGDRVQHAFGYHSREIRRILAVAVRLARSRSGQLALVVKPGGLPVYSQLWVEQFEELTTRTDLQTRVLEVDNACFQLIQAGADFDVVVAPNLFGDILTDVSALLLGSRGASFSGNFGQPGVAVYQTAHGAAHDLAGRGVANPVGQVLATAMMLRESFGLGAEAAAIEAAVDQVLAAGFRTADVSEPGCSVLGTHALGTRIVAALEQLLPTLIATP